MPSPEPQQPRHLLHVFSTFAVGGPQVRFAMLANLFGARYRHTIIAMDGVYACAERLVPSLDVTLAPLPVEKGGGLSIRNLRAFRRALKDIQPDLLVTYNWGTIEWALANRLRPLSPQVHLEDGFGPEEANGLLKRRALMRRLALGSRVRVVVPSRLLERVATQIWGLSPQRVTFVPNGVDCARFAATRKDWPLPIPDDALIVGSIGALREEKNLARLIRAMAALPDHVHLVLAGDGPQRPHLQETVAALDLGSRVHFTGHVTAPEALLGRFDIFAMSSDTEQMPIGLIEAMAAGLPVVATDVGDVREMVAQENRALIVPASDEPALADALAALARDLERRTRLGAANRHRAEADYTLERMAAAYDTLFAS